MFSKADISGKIADVPNFPKPGIVFKDISPILADPNLFYSLIVHLSELVPPTTTHFAAIESRGFLLGSALSHHMAKGLVLIRKAGKLPRKTIGQNYDLEYGQDRLEMHVDDLGSGDRVCIVDDVLATGGTASATAKLLKQTGCEVLGAVFLMELSFLKGASRLGVESRSLIQY